MPTIALVDDDRNILTSVSIALEAEGYRIMTYTDGASALDGFKTSPPDLAILDIKMPRMDGVEVLRRLRQGSNLPVIFLTSKDDEMDEVVGFNVGADDYIKKPFSQRLLSERVKALHCALSASDNGAVGIEAPAYFALDDIEAAVARVRFGGKTDPAIIADIAREAGLPPGQIEALTPTRACTSTTRRSTARMPWPPRSCSPMP